MKTVTRTSLGFNVPVKFYESYEEADKAAGVALAALEQTNANLYYRAGIAQEAREIIAEVVERVTGIKREQVPVMRDKKNEKGEVVKGADGKPEQVQATTKDDKGNQVPVFEYVLSEEDYVKAALAKANLTTEDKKLQDEITKACNAANEGAGLAVDIKTPERKPAKPKTLPKKYAEKGSAVFSDPAKLAAFRKEYKGLLKEDLAADVNAEGVGWALKRFMEAREEALFAKL
jgi:hypothetical protein